MSNTPHTDIMDKIRQDIIRKIMNEKAPGVHLVTAYRRDITAQDNSQLPIDRFGGKLPEDR